MTAIDSLRNLLPISAGASEFCSPEDWQEVERQISICPPPDYRQLLAVYGSGFIGLEKFDPYWLVLRSPLAKSGYGNFIDGFRTHISLLTEQKSQFPRYIPYPLLPQVGGLFPFAHDSCGFEYYWLTKGNPVDWPLVIDNDSGDFVELQMSFTEFLLSLARGVPPHTSFEKTKHDKLIWTPIQELIH